MAVNICTIFTINITYECAPRKWVVPLCMRANTQPANTLKAKNEFSLAFELFFFAFVLHLSPVFCRIMHDCVFVCGPETNIFLYSSCNELVLFTALHIYLCIDCISRCQQSGMGGAAGNAAEPILK